MLGAIAGMMGDHKITMLSSMMQGTIRKDFAKLNRQLNKIKKCFDKDLYMPDSLKDENEKAYAYRDAVGNYYELNFGLTY